jgi:hypothetical protein
MKNCDKCEHQTYRTSIICSSCKWGSNYKLKVYYQMFWENGRISYDKLGPGNISVELFMLIHWMRKE